MKRPFAIVGALVLAAHAEIEIQWPSAAGKSGTATNAPLEAEDYGQLELKTGERFKVRLEVYDPVAGVLTARHPLIRGPLVIEAAAVRCFTAAPMRTDAPDVQGWIAQTDDGDRFRGVEVTLEKDTLRLQSPYGFPMILPRGRLQTLTAGPGSGVVYEGPVAGEEWISNKRHAVLEGAFLSLDKNERLGRPLSLLPRQARIDFTLAGNLQPSFMAFFYLEEPDLAGEIGGEAYRLTFSGSFGNQQGILHRAIRGQGWQVIGSPVHNPFGQDWQRWMAGFRVSVFFNLDERRIWLRVNGRPTAEWSDPRPMDQNGCGLAFASEAPSTVTELRVQQWDGRAETMEDHEAPGEAESLWLKSGDRITGDILAIASDAVRLRSQLGELTIPLDQVYQCRFRHGGGETPPSPDALAVRLLDGSFIRLTNACIADGLLSGQNTHAGPMRLPLKAVTQILWPTSAEKGHSAPILPAERDGTIE